ncbi:hypothetical protein BpPP18_05800 [Weizmannia acidilactici]|nr:hypothetical protein BpPP18_05800 [Weizmannia acidilactici]
MTPYDSQMEAKRSPNTPVTTTTTWSPSWTTLQTALSNADVPLPAMTMTGSLLPKTGINLVATCLRLLEKTSLRWATMGWFIACFTRSGTGVGPGVNKDSLQKSMCASILHF